MALYAGSGFGRNAQTTTIGATPAAQVSPIACQLGPALALAGPPPMMLVPLMSDRRQSW
jgi:hypothetical protein